MLRLSRRESLRARTLSFLSARNMRWRLLLAGTAYSGREMICEDQWEAERRPGPHWVWAPVEGLDSRLA